MTSAKLITMEAVGKAAEDMERAYENLFFSLRDMIGDRMPAKALTALEAATDAHDRWFALDRAWDDQEDEDAELQESMAERISAAQSAIERGEGTADHEAFLTAPETLNLIAARKAAE